MILFRARERGTAEWTNLVIQTPGEGSDEPTEMERNLSAIIGSALGTSELHVQTMSDEGEWEDVE